jgi:hypothetical protein
MAHVPRSRHFAQYTKVLPRRVDEGSVGLTGLCTTSRSYMGSDAGAAHAVMSVRTSAAADVEAPGADLSWPVRNSNVAGGSEPLMECRVL